jgi:hypothetical protein
VQGISLSTRGMPGAWTAPSHPATNSRQEGMIDLSSEFRIHIRIHMFLSLPYPVPLVTSTDSALDPSLFCGLIFLARIFLYYVILIIKHIFSILKLLNFMIKTFKNMKKQNPESHRRFLYGSASGSVNQK